MLQLFRDNRMHCMNEWLRYCGYFKIIANHEQVRSTLLNNLILGMPQYGLVPHDEGFIVVLKAPRVQSASNQQQQQQQQQLLRAETRTPSVLGMNTFRTVSRCSPNLYTPKLQLQLQQQQQQQQQQAHADSPPMATYADYYEPLLDEFLNIYAVTMNDNDDTLSSTNMILITRALLVVDVTRSLNDVDFQEKYAYNLCQSVESLVHQVTTHSFTYIYKCISSLLFSSTQTTTKNAL